MSHTSEDELFAELRSAMVEDQLLARGLPDGPVLQAMREVPRERFLPPGRRHSAYDDGAQAIGGGQTISQPYVVALTLIEAGVGPGVRVLDVGTGSGYAAAVAARAGALVYGIERRADLAGEASLRLRELGLDVPVVHGDALLGLAEHAPYDAIVAAAAGEALPDVWLEQLAPGGRVVAPVGPTGAQRLIRWTKTTDGVRRETLLDVAYVPLLPGVVDESDRPR